MRLFKYIVVITVVLLSTTTRAEERSRFNFAYKLNGSSSTETNAGKISGSISEDGKTATLTMNPAVGNYITADNITVVKTISGNHAQTYQRKSEIGGIQHAIESLFVNVENK